MTSEGLLTKADFTPTEVLILTTQDEDGYIDDDLFTWGIWGENLDATDEEIIKALNESSPSWWSPVVAILKRERRTIGVLR
jgi:hypothetical protein